MASARRLAANIFTGFFNNLLRVGTQLVMLPLMARLLGPAELGLYALALPMINFVLILSDAGLGDSLAREHQDDRLVWSSSFWGLMALTGVGLLAVNAAARIVARVANQPSLPSVVLLLSATLPLFALTIIPSARMLRMGNTVPGAMGDAAGTVIGAGTGIALAVSGFGVWSLVGQYLITYVVRVVAYNVAQPFVPGLEFSARSLLAHTGMGGQIVVSRLGELATSMVERAQVSLRLGAVAVGGYANASQIGLFASNALGSPIWANLYYVAINRDPPAVSQAFVRSHRLFSLAIFPVAALLAVAAPIGVPILFGPKWHDSIASIIVMVLCSPFGNLAAFHSAIYYARGWGRYVLAGQLAVLVFRIAVVFLFWRGGIFGLSLGLGGVGVGYYFAVTVLTARSIGVGVGELFGAALTPFVASAIAAASFAWLLGAHGGLFGLIVAGIGAIPVYLAALCLLDRKHVTADLRMALAVLRSGAAPATA